ncbi:hypothetical protein ACLOAU_13400 [Niabella sp. CJ426]|jgi:hypothetical protein|uniref:hypothetical protein n=1 Tax=Niabella sp. CJ426 TaxID=3393740 RepID=UPI003D01F551
MKNFLLLIIFSGFVFCCSHAQDNPISLEFKPIIAKIAANELQVEWSSITENNINRYDIEVSGDGKSFTKIGNVLSKAEGGNSTSPLNYTFARSATGLLAGVTLFLLPILGFSANKARRNKTMFILAFVFIGAAALTGCRKSEVAKNETLYLRVGQVDNTNHILYSKIVKVQ